MEGTMYLPYLPWNTSSGLIQMTEKKALFYLVHYYVGFLYMQQNLALTYTSCGICASFIQFSIIKTINLHTYYLNELKVILLITTYMHTILMGNCLIIHRTCKNDSPFLLVFSSYKERAKKTARLAESKWGKKIFGKYTSLNNQDLPIYLGKIYCK